MFHTKTQSNTKLSTKHKTRRMLGFSSSLSRRIVQSAKDLTQKRAYWQEVVMRKRGPDGKYKYEDPALVSRRFQDARRADGEYLLEVHLWNDRHEKPWMRKKRMAEKKRYDFDKKHVLDLAKYIHFVKDNKDT